jgi:aspartate/methionine/tyrosine aminotransferase
MRTASRLDHIEPFYVMECAKAADEIARGPLCDPTRGGRPMIYLNIGEPDFTAAPLVVEAATRCMAEGRTQYTHATGLAGLREDIARWYAQRFGLNIAAERIIITAGASAALQLITAALVDQGDEVLLPDPSYACNRHFVAAAGGRAVLLPSGPEQRYQLDANAVRSAWGGHTRGVLLASPSNPTGTSIARSEMRAIVEAVRERGGFTLVDEIYLGLSYDEAFGHSALEHGDDVIAINSFSKYFGMTGWRLGWLVLPPALVPAVEKLAQNLYICASSIAQHAARACFEPASLAEYERRRAAFRERRDFIVPALQRLGLPVPVVPDGAFYAYADVSAHADPHKGGSWDFCFDLMRRAQVALTPGRDFGPAAGERHLRLSFASSMPQLQEAVQRLEQALIRA